MDKDEAKLATVVHELKLRPRRVMYGVWIALDNYAANTSKPKALRRKALKAIDLITGDNSGRVTNADLDKHTKFNREDRKEVAKSKR